MVALLGGAKEITAVESMENGGELGKEFVANAIHQDSPRPQKPFIKISCASMPETLLESELFGHERGAFTGALTRKVGRFQLADGDSLFLDYVNVMRSTTQVKLLHVLQEREFEPFIRAA